MKQLATGISLHVLALLALFSGIGCSRRPDLDTAERFQQAESAFSQADSADDFARVAGRYERLLADGFVSGVVYYNLGNAWMRAGETGRAIAAWRQSQRYRPRDVYLSANLQSALTAAGSTEPVHPHTGVAGYVFFWQNWLSYQEKFYAATALLMAACVAVLAQSLLRHHRVAHRFTVGCGLLFLVLAASAAWDWQRFDRTTHGVVVQDNVEARKGNSESYETAFTEPLPEGSEFVVLEERADWLNIQINGLGTAWIPARAAVTW